MALIDTHAHIYLSDFNKDIDEVIKRSKESGVTKIIIPSIAKKNHHAQIELSEKYPALVLPLIGLHPTSVKEDYKEELSFVEQELKKNKYYGIGETGIDLYWDTTFKNFQINAFEHQLSLSVEYQLPVVIHQRNSLDEIFTVLSNFSSENLRGIFHCYSGNTEQAEKVIEMGFLLGIGGVLTYKNSNLQEIVKHINLKHIVLETDAPFLSPVPYRGKRNEPSRIKIIAAHLANTKGIDISEVENITAENANVVFGL